MEPKKYETRTTVSKSLPTVTARSYASGYVASFVYFAPLGDNVLW
jgi:hypothetical protein